MKFLILLIPLAFFLRMLMERLNTRNREITWRGRNENI